MYLHLGRDVATKPQTIVGIFALATSPHSHLSRAFFTAAEQKAQTVVVTDELPKSAVVCFENDVQTVYITQVSAQTLLRRSQKGNLPDNVL